MLGADEAAFAAIVGDLAREGAAEVLAHLRGDADADHSAEGEDA